MHPGNKFSQLGAATVGVTVFLASRAFSPIHSFASSFESPAAERWPGLLSFSFSSSGSITMQSTCFCMKCAYLQQVQRQGRASFVIKASVARQAVSMRFFFFFNVSELCQVHNYAYANVLQKLLFFR